MTETKKEEKEIKPKHSGIEERPYHPIGADDKEKEDEETEAEDAEEEEDAA